MSYRTILSVLKLVLLLPIKVYLNRGGNKRAV